MLAGVMLAGVMLAGVMLGRVLWVPDLCDCTTQMSAVAFEQPREDLLGGSVGLGFQRH